MRNWLPLIAMLAGCAAPASPTPAVPSPASPKVDVAPSVPQAQGNPNRLYQLKDLKTVDVSVRGKLFRAWVMDDVAKTQEGMMFLTDAEVKPNEGMLFVFDKTQRKADGRGFWMHNTLIPLDIVYLGENGRVVSIANGKPQDDTSLPPAGDYRRVLELKGGTAARLGLKPGDPITISKPGPNR